MGRRIYGTSWFWAQIIRNWSEICPWSFLEGNAEKRPSYFNDPVRKIFAARYISCKDSWAIRISKNGSITDGPWGGDLCPRLPYAVTFRANYRRAIGKFFYVLLVDFPRWTRINLKTLEFRKMKGCAGLATNV